MRNLFKISSCAPAVNVGADEIRRPNHHGQGERTPAAVDPTQDFKPLRLGAEPKGYGRVSSAKRVCVLASLLNVCTLSPALPLEAAALRLHFPAPCNFSGWQRCGPRHSRRSAHRQCYRGVGKDPHHSPSSPLTGRSDDCLGSRWANGDRDSGCAYSRSRPPPSFDRRERCSLHGRGSGVVTGQQGAGLHLGLQCPQRRSGASRHLYCYARCGQQCAAASEPSSRRGKQPGVFPPTAGRLPACISRAQPRPPGL